MGRFGRDRTPAKPPAAPVGHGKPGKAPFEGAVPVVYDFGGNPLSDLPQASPAAFTLRMRLSAGIHAVRAAEVEILEGGIRIAGGNGILEFNLWTDSWVDIRVIRHLDDQK
jgi:hypothetical protein